MRQRRSRRDFASLFRLDRHNEFYFWMKKRNSKKIARKVSLNSFDGRRKIAEFFALRCFSSSNLSRNSNVLTNWWWKNWRLHSFSPFLLRQVNSNLRIDKFIAFKEQQRRKLLIKTLSTANFRVFYSFSFPVFGFYDLYFYRTRSKHERDYAAAALIYGCCSSFSRLILCC